MIWRNFSGLFARSALVVATALLAAPCAAFTGLYYEDFEGIPLDSSPTYNFPNAYSHDPPPGWDLVNDLPGLNNPSIGVLEWEGWSFVRQEFWKFAGSVTGDLDGRELFRPRGQYDPNNVVAVADPDLWNDLPRGDPANRLGYYNTFLVTPDIDLTPRDKTEEHMALTFEASWMGVECCDDGLYLEPGQRLQNNQTAVVQASIDGGTPFEVLRWESAPFRDGQGRPTSEPIDPTGTPNTPNDFFIPFDLTQRVSIDLSDLVGPPGFATAEGIALAQAAASGKKTVKFQFAMEDAGDDGWWAIDNVEMVSYAALLGDMNLSGDLDVGDYDAFALAMLDTDAYRSEYFGVLPAENGSLDDVFNYDDIPHFLSVMEGVGAPATAFAMAFFAVPEPSSAVLAAMVGVATIGGLRRDT